jgi:hypothetical protein
MSLRSDVEDFSNVFNWKGPIASDAVNQFLVQEATQIPDDLHDLWLAKGSGDLFESEELYGPDGSEEDISVMQTLMSDEGLLTQNFVIFHRGTWLSAIDRDSGLITAFGAGLVPVAKPFRSLDQWYMQLIRPEFRERYGLT